MFNKKNPPQELIKKGVLAGVIQAAYTLAVAGFFLCSDSLFREGSRSMIFGIVAMLTLLVLSVAISGALMLGYPAYYFLKKEFRAGLTFLVAAVSTLALIFLALILGEVFIY